MTDSQEDEKGKANSYMIFFKMPLNAEKIGKDDNGYNMLHAKKALLKYATLSHIFGSLLTVKHALSYL